MAQQELAGVIYYDGADWDILLAGGHGQIGVSSVTSNTNGFTINFDFTATQVYSFVISPDNVMAAAGVLCGASVGFTTATVSLYQVAKCVTGHVSRSGSSFTVFNQTGSLSYESFDESTGELSLLHDDCNDFQACMMPDELGLQPRVSDLTAGRTKIKFFDRLGGQVTKYDDRMKFYFSRETHGYGVRVGSTSVLGAISSANFFFRGLFEVA